MSMVKSVNEMDEYTLKRWMALIEGVNLICNNAKKYGIPEDQVDFKQNHLVDYIDEHTEKIHMC